MQKIINLEFQYLITPSVKVVITPNPFLIGSFLLYIFS